MYKASNGAAELIDDGIYKASVLSVEERDNFDKSAKNLVITWKLGNGREYFDRISKDKDGSGDYNHFKIGLILYALKITEVNSTAELITKLVGKTCKITIAHQYSDFKKGDYNFVKSYDIDLEEEVKDDDSQVNINDLPF